MSRSGFLRDNHRPTHVHPFRPFNKAHDSEHVVLRRAISVSCGTFHSAIIEESGAVWTWGARGHCCLGHNDAPLSGPWASKVNAIFSAALNSTKVMVPYELLPWCQTWAQPRCVKSLSDRYPGSGWSSDDIKGGHVMRSTRIVQASCGDMHTALLSATGRVFLCGDGPCVPPFVVSNEGTDVGAGQSGEEGVAPTAAVGKEEQTEDGSDASVKRQTSSKGGAAASTEEVAVCPVLSPRCPSSAWLQRLAMRRVLLIASAGLSIFALLDDDIVATSLSKKIFLSLQSESEQVQYAEDVGAKVTAAGNSLEMEDAEEDDLADYSISHDASTADKSSKSLFEQRGCADCMIISSGKILLAHRAVLASRSSVLRDKLVEEAPGGDDFNQPTQILLPELLHGTARILLQYIYTDNLPSRVVGNPSMLRNLARAAIDLKIPRLQIICHRLLQLHYGAKGTGKADVSQPSMVGSELIPATLSRDFGNIVGDPQYADIRFIAEGRTLYAHRFILEARCPYFRAMFRSGMMESFVVNGKPTDIVVPDSFVCLLRMLIFIYTDFLPEGSEAALLEDLMTADRYHVMDMRCLCENMLATTSRNWRDILRVSDIVKSSHLKVDAMCFIRDHLGDSLQTDKAESVLSEYRDVMERIMQTRQIAFPSPPSRLLVDHVAANVKMEEEKINAPIPWGMLAIMIMLIVIYSYLVRSVNLGQMVPVLNILMMFGVLYYSYRKLITE